MHREVTRYIKDSVSNMLWGRAAGRCQFAGCNRLLSRSSVTQEDVNVAERAHIWSFSEDGPRGNAGVPDEDLNDLPNLILACHDCHRKIDQEKDGGRYTAPLLQSWKAAHEARVELVTGIASDKRSHVLMYGANVGDQAAPLEFNGAVAAMFPARYPAEATPIRIGMVNSAWRDRDAGFWGIEETNLARQYAKLVEPRLAAGDISHLSVFGFAPQPLLARLGACLTDIPDVEVYQLRREPRGWARGSGAAHSDLVAEAPAAPRGAPALVLGVSATITPDRVTSVLGAGASVWALRAADPRNDWLRSTEQLRAFRRELRRMLDRIKAAHGQTTTIHVFPALPVAAAVELGRVRMPKADAPLLIYDQVNDRSGFVPAITLGGGPDARSPQ